MVRTLSSDIQPSFKLSSLAPLGDLHRIPVGGQRGISRGMGNLAGSQMRSLPDSSCHTGSDFTCATGGTLMDGMESVWPAPVQAIAAYPVPGHSAGSSWAVWWEAVVPALCGHTPTYTARVWHNSLPHSVGEGVVMKAPPCLSGDQCTEESWQGRGVLSRCPH